MVLLATNALWIALEYLWLDWDWPIKFRIIRIIYFGFLSFSRVDIVDTYDADEKYWSILWKSLKMFIADMLSMIVVVWAFGRSCIFWVSILECAFVLSALIFPERLCSGHMSWLWQISLRSEDYRKMWRRKQHV